MTELSIYSRIALDLTSISCRRGLSTKLPQSGQQVWGLTHVPGWWSLPRNLLLWLTLDIQSTHSSLEWKHELQDLHNSSVQDGTYRVILWHRWQHSKYDVISSSVNIPPTCCSPFHFSYLQLLSIDFKTWRKYSLLHSTNASPRVSKN